MARYALVERKSGIVVNIIEAHAQWKPPGGMQVIDAADAAPGDTWDGQSFSKPPPPAAVYTPDEILAEVLGAGTVAELRAATALVARALAGPVPKGKE